MERDLRLGNESKTAESALKMALLSSLSTMTSLLIVVSA